MKVWLLLVVLLLPGCSEAADKVGQVQSGASRVKDCAGLVSDVASAGLSRVPTQAEAEDALGKLDDRIASIQDEQVKTAATDLRARLDEVLAAVRSGDTSAVQRAADSARTAAGAVATTCGIPLDQVLPSG